MGSSNKSKQPIMSPDQERFTAFEGVLQWAYPVLLQSDRLSALRPEEKPIADLTARHKYLFAVHTECHFCTIATNKLMEYREWAQSFGLFSSIDFSWIDQFFARDIADLRNMREHVVEYFQGSGRAANRWIYETPEYRTDASSLVGSMIGGGAVGRKKPDAMGVVLTARG
jgi:hypothetical protein